MLNKFKKLFSLDNPFRLLYHNIRAVIANVMYGFPSKNMTIIGVTGTNGKTTTCNIIAKGLRQAGKKVFMFTTINIIIGDEEYKNEIKMTSPDAFELQRLLSEAKKKGCEVAIIETASHGIKMHRIWGIEYDTCVLTNITQDHLDLHKTMDDYVNTKLKIFKNLIRYKRKPGVKKTAILNTDSDYIELFKAETYDSMFLYGNGNNSNLKAYDIKSNLEKTTFSVRVPGADLKIESKLRGEFNIYNVLAAIGVFTSMNIKGKEIEEIIKNVENIPGRMEEVPNELGFKIFIDYAHTPDALKNAIGTLRNIEGRGKLITVFGGCGDRDRSNRPVMGKVISELSDIVILTQDDDYTEKTENIIKDILPGVERKEGENFWIIPDRKEAIRNAIITAKKKDIIILAGKGDEHVLVTNEGKIEWHDRTVVEEILKGIDDNVIVTHP